MTPAMDSCSKTETVTDVTGSFGGPSHVRTRARNAVNEGTRHICHTGVEKQIAARQSRAMSLLEAVVNVVVGYGIAVLTQAELFPLFGIRLAIRDNLLIGAVFTVVSIMRSYRLRRTFEAIRLRRP
jgi:hypothetical protein